MLYRVNFCVSHTEPIQPVNTLTAVEADDPLAAVKLLLAQGRVPQTHYMRRARVVLNTYPDGSARQVLRVPISGENVSQLEWSRPKESLDR